MNAENMAIEQQAREILAAELDADGRHFTARVLRNGGTPPSLSLCQSLRAITRALTRPAPTEAEVEAAANAIFDFAADPRAPAWEDVSHDTRDYYRCLARAALGVGNG